MRDDTKARIIAIAVKNPNKIVGKKFDRDKIKNPADIVEAV